MVPVGGTTAAAGVPSVDDVETDDAPTAFRAITWKE